ncbi:MAG: hypothetical protein PHX51_08655 [Clostridia bacterium]|nr:hypothetical protein [Clostridia bacterium]
MKTKITHTKIVMYIYYLRSRGIITPTVGNNLARIASTVSKPKMIRLHVELRARIKRLLRQKDTGVDMSARNIRLEHNGRY